MSQYDVAGLIRTYSEKCSRATNTKQLQNIVRELKQELISKEISKMKVEN